MAATGPGFAGMTLLVAALVAAPIAAKTPKYESTLTYMIPADGPPSFDGHLEATLFTRQRPTKTADAILQTIARYCSDTLHIHTATY